MIKIEQVRLLEQRVQKVISRIGELEHENSTLREKLQTYQDRIADLELRIEGFTSNQEEIEAGILNALQRLDEVEDALGEEGIEQRHIEVDAAAADTEPAVDDSEPPLRTDESPAAESPAAEGFTSDESPAAGNSGDESPADEIGEESGEQAEEPGPELDIF